jgi:predicted phosphatase
MFKNQPNNQKCSLSKTPYKEIITHENTPGDVHTIAFNFNNIVRMYEPRGRSVRMIANTAQAQMEATDAIVSLYQWRQGSDILKILRLNAWNEWGEDMVIEPSHVKQAFFLELIRASLMLVVRGDFELQCHKL